MRVFLVRLFFCSCRRRSWTQVSLLVVEFSSHSSLHRKSDMFLTSSFFLPLRRSVRIFTTIRWVKYYVLHDGGEFQYTSAAMRSLLIMCEIFLLSFPWQPCMCIHLQRFFFLWDRQTFSFFFLSSFPVSLDWWKTSVARLFLFGSSEAPKKEPQSGLTEVARFAGRISQIEISPRWLTKSAFFGNAAMPFRSLVA